MPESTVIRYNRLSIEENQFVALGPKDILQQNAYNLLLQSANNRDKGETMPESLTTAKYNRLSIQLPDETLTALNKLAEVLTLKPGTLARQLIIEALAKRGEAKRR